MRSSSLSWVEADGIAQGHSIAEGQGTVTWLYYLFQVNKSAIAHEQRDLERNGISRDIDFVSLVRSPGLVL